MRALVTGSAGFIGSTLADRLVADGWIVRGVDSLNSSYDPSYKRLNVQHLDGASNFELRVEDLSTCDLEPLLDGVDVVFHLAGQPGVRQSWSTGFASYNEANVNVTQRLLEAVRERDVHRFVYASSSSVYGDVSVVPTDVSHSTRPHSPYGVTKLAGELLCTAYAANFDVPTVCLRYFTVYGPRQRPDMATHRLIEAALDGATFPLFGDGQQVRDFTYVDDIVNATVLAASAEVSAGTVVNAAGGSSISLVELIELVGESVGRPVRIGWQEAQPGDVRRTGGAIGFTQECLGWTPMVDLVTGVGRQVEWHRARR